MDLSKVINQVVDRVCSLRSDEVISAAMEESVKKESAQLLNMIEENKYIKVPIVGDFNAGKTSLINAILEEDESLPVGTKPETDIPCEIRSAQDGELAHIVVMREGEVVFHDSIEKYKNARVFPGDYAVLYSTSQRVKKWYSKGIVLVDMPGASSGIKEHNEAITRYISQGTIFAYLIDSRKGSISRSGIDFIEEIKQYGLNIAFFVSRIDLQHSTQINNVVECISEQIGEGISIGRICAKEQQIADFESFVTNIDTIDVCRQKLNPIVKVFVKNQITLLKEVSIALATASNEDLNTRISEIQSQINQIENALTQSLKSVDSPEKSTDDILGSVSFAIRNKAPNIANVFIETSGGERLEAVNEALLQIIRPTLLKAFKQEQEEFIETLNTQINKLAERLLDTMRIPQGIYDELISRNEVLIIQGVRLAAERLMGIDNPIAQILGQLLNFFAEYVPDLMRQLFDNQNRLRGQLEEQVSGPICRNIIKELRTPVEQQVRLMQSRIIEETRKQYEQRINQLNALLKEFEHQRNIEDEQADAKNVECIEIIAELENLYDQLQ